MESENYKERYEQVTEKAKRILDIPYAEHITMQHWTAIKNIIEDIFPEIKENNKEKKIIRCLKEIADWGCAKNIATDCDVELKDVKSWLEKLEKQREKESTKWLKDDDDMVCEIEESLHMYSSSQSDEVKEQVIREREWISSLKERFEGK